MITADICDNALDRLGETETICNAKLKNRQYSSEEVIDLTLTHAAHNYHPIPMVWSRAEGVYVWDPEGRRYYDFLSSYSTANQGHCHPKIIKALTDQASKLTLSSRAFYNDMFGRYAKFVTEYFGYDMVLPMNTGSEAVETAIKLARKWGYEKKGIPVDQAMVLACAGNYHGRTIGTVSLSTDPDCRDGYGPYVPLVGSVCPTTGEVLHYNDVEGLRRVLERHGPRIAGFLVEPIQGEAGIVVPDEGYLKQCYDLCKQHNVLFIADEVQTGCCRTGKLLAVHHEGIRPDVVILGKALSGGAYPVSAVLADRDVMLCIKPGQHGSTFGGNPLASAVSIAALEVLRDENLGERAGGLGERFRQGLRNLKSPLIAIVRGKGLLNAIVVDESVIPGRRAWDLCLLLKKHGILTKTTHENVIRLSPPLVITEEQIDECIAIIGRALEDIMNWDP